MVEDNSHGFGHTGKLNYKSFVATTGIISIASNLTELLLG
jgi:hypothetical protein